MKGGDSTSKKNVIKQLDKDNLLNKEVKVNWKERKLMKGIIKGRLESYPYIWLPELDTQFMVTWDLAYRAVHYGVVIQA